MNFKLRYVSSFLLSGYLLCNISFAQENNPLINSGEKIKDAYQQFYKKDYKEAIKIFQQINKSDTNYYNALFETVNALQSDSQNIEAIDLAKKGIKLFPHMFSQFAMQIGNSLDNLNREEEAMAYYDTAMAHNPNDFLIPFNKGIAYYRLEKNEKAKESFQQTLLINPYHFKSHYLLGIIYLKEGNLIPAMMAFSTYLVIAPKGENNGNAISLLNDISKGTDEILKYAKEKKPGDEKSFNQIQEILLSKIALNPNYKAIVKIDDNLVKQLQVVNEKMEFNKSDKGFAMQFYVPFFTQMFKEKLFEPMVYTMFANVDIKPIQNWRKSNKKSLDEFSIEGSKYFNNIKSTRTLNSAEREEVENKFIYDNSTLVAKGIYKEVKKQFIPQGTWEFYFENGQVRSKGKFNDEGEKTGVWINNYDNGKIKEKITFKENQQEGLSEGFFENSNKWYSENYKAGQIFGKQTIYFYNGLVKAELNFKDGIKDGLQKYYNYKGVLTSTETMKDGKLNGPVKTFFKNGELNDESAYINNIENSDYKKYYKSGILESSGKVVNGKKDGLWTSYYDDGKIKNKTTFSAGEITGEFWEYYNNGVVSMTGNYSRKKLDGKIIYKDEDDKVYCESIYDRGKLKEIKFLDKKGEMISSTSTRKGAANITFYSPQGLKTSEGFFDKDGSRKGKHISYFTSGKISEESNYTDDQLDGKLIKYYTNGKISEDRNYKDGNEDGYYKSYFLNGKIKREGWLVKGSMEQTWISYNVNGDVVKKVYYLNNSPSGYTEYFYPGNIPDYSLRYINGWVEEVTQYDTTGSIIQSNVFESGNGNYTFKHINGKTLSNVPQKNYMNNGVKESFFYNGQIASKSILENDDLTGNFIAYHKNGKTKAEGKYVDDKKDGIWKYYYSDGKLQKEETYFNGELNGKIIKYKPTGDKDVLITYKNGELNGPYIIYGEKNEVAVVYNYENDLIKSYQYEVSKDKLSDSFKIKNYTGKVSSQYPNGKPGADLNFVDNNLDGHYRYYYSNGNLMLEGNFVSGYYDGVQKFYHPNGKLAKQSNYILGNLYGPSTSYNPDGTLAFEENYYDDDIHGINKYYDSKKIRTLTYYYGYLTSEKEN